VLTRTGMNEPDIAYRARLLSGAGLIHGTAARLVCAALILSVLTLVFRIASIW